MSRPTAARSSRIAGALRLGRLAPLVLCFGVGACFATRNDVRVVQSDLASMRTELLRGNVEQREALAQAMRVLAVASDSVTNMSNRLTSLQGSILGGLRGVNDQLIQVQGLLNQSASTLQRLRAEQEQRANQALVAAAPPAATGALPGDTTRPPAPAVSQTGPNELYMAARNNLQRGSIATARQAYLELLANYPTSDLAPKAQLGIAMSYDQEKQYASALTEYATVSAKYPDAPEAPTALYKRALILMNQGKRAEAKPLLQLITTRYPQSDVFGLASDLLKTIR